MSIKDKVNGSLKSIIIGIITIVISLGGTLYLSGQQAGVQAEKVKTLEEKTVPGLEKDFIKHCDKQEIKEKEMGTKIDTLQFTTMKMLFLMEQMNKNLGKINKKLKID